MALPPNNIHLINPPINNNRPKAQNPIRRSIRDYSMPGGERILAWFLLKYFPPTKTVKLRNDITYFTQYEAWEHFKDIIRRFPHHGMADWMEVQAFYNGLTPICRSTRG
ncbi:hypothetical protein J1N35_027927 [Gossypium stocksii]|uniref:Retrotransposon gag domain-containing protein n=1 Tax=Gossypium stocksii TaxID=47602 RepID=A0A9D3VAW3_9ROSI|nr:hypothetical protein J1N35_027927 [Gossypium stocksii]